MAEGDTPTFPVTAYAVSALHGMDAIAIQLAFVSHPMQGLAQSDPGRAYVLQSEQARAVRDAIDNALRSLEERGAQSVPKKEAH